MHKEILTTEQVSYLPLVGSFSKQFGLVGGTAIALHIGHRESIDFDLFSMDEFNNASLKRKIEARTSITTTLVNKKGELTFVIKNVKFTFFHFPFVIPFDQQFEHGIRLPSLLTLAAMKSYALGQRAKWKDYVDLYFIFRDFHPIEEVLAHTTKLFAADFNPKLLRVQLAYFEDINYSEAVTFKPGYEVSDEEVKAKLTEWSLS